MNILIIDVAAIITFRIKKLTRISNRSETWRSVTAFKEVEKSSLYHTDQETEGVEKVRTEDGQESRATKDENEAE